MKYPSSDIRMSLNRDIQNVSLYWQHAHGYSLVVMNRFKVLDRLQN